MINFSLPDELRQAAEVAQRFADEQLRPQERAHEVARALPLALHAQARAIGLDRIAWPETLDGADLGVVARVRVLEALSSGDPGAALALDGLSAVASALLSFAGSEALAEQVEWFHALGSDAARAVLVVDLDDALSRDHATMSGTLPWVPAERVDLLAVLSRTGLTLLRDGLTLTQVRGSGLQAAGASRLNIDKAPVFAHWDNPTAAAQALAGVRLDTAALMVGQMIQASDYARRYAMDRVAFGKPIAHHQGLAFLIVEMRMAVDGARSLLHEAAWRLQTGRPTAIAAAADAFVQAVEAGQFVGPNAVQILGAAGFMREHPVEKAMRDLRTLALLAGGADKARDDATNDLTDFPPQSVDATRSIHLLAEEL